jgi:hypothetical protein
MFSKEPRGNSEAASPRAGRFLTRETAPSRPGAGLSTGKILRPLRFGTSGGCGNTWLPIESGLPRPGLFPIDGCSAARTRPQARLRDIERANGA